MPVTTSSAMPSPMSVRTSSSGDPAQGAPPVALPGADPECDAAAAAARPLDIVRAPEVRLVARQVWVDDPDIAWATDTEVAGEKLVEFAGRHCYMSFGKGRKTNGEYIRHLLEMGHGSVLEHAVYTLRIWGVSRTCTHELI